MTTGTKKKWNLSCKPRRLQVRFLKCVMASAMATMLITLIGCSSGTDAAAKKTALAGAPVHPREVLYEGDIIAITCESDANLNTTMKIPLTGMLDLAFIGQVQAAGRTTKQLQDELLERYHDAQVLAEVINVKLIESAVGVYVGGAVLLPGKIPMDRPMTALEAIMEAGGYDPNRARLSKVTVVRLEDGKQMTYHLDLNKVIKGTEAIPFYLQPFDTLQVPSRTFNW